MQEMMVQILCQEDPLEEETATHSSILAWRISWREEPDGLYTVHVVSHKTVGHDLATKTTTNLSFNFNSAVS